MSTYKQDNMTIHNADCMEIMAGYEDDYFDLAVVDPPYGINYAKRKAKTKNSAIQHKPKEWDSSTPNQCYFDELRRVSKNQIIWGGNYFILPPSRGFLIWDKCQGEGMDQAMCEFAWMSLDVSAKIFKTSVQQIQNRIHPTQKPVKLYNWIYANYAEEGQKILDTHGGSFSNAIAAHYAGMEFVGCELDEDYYKAAIERIKKETSQLAFDF